MTHRGPGHRYTLPWSFFYANNGIELEVYDKG